MTIRAQRVNSEHEVVVLTDGRDKFYLDRNEIKETVELLSYYLENGSFPRDWSFVNKSHCDCYEVTESFGVNVELFKVKVVKFYFTIEDVVYILSQYIEDDTVSSDLHNEDKELLFSTIVNVSTADEYRNLYKRLVEISHEVYSY